MKIAEPVCAGAGYELVDLRYLHEGSWVVRVFIDHLAGHAPPGQHIGFDDCERVSRELSAVFDVEDPLPHAYRLEVSSPGVERPLRTADHFRRVVGEQAKVSLQEPQDGRRNFTGRIVEVVQVEEAEGDTLIDIDVNGTHHRLPLSQISNARLLPDWDQLMAQSK